MNLSHIPDWRPVVARGVLALLFALFTLVWTGATLTALVIAFGMYSLADGIIAVAVGSRIRRRDRGWMFPMEGLVGVAVGLCALVWTEPTIVAVTLLVALWALATGGFEVAAAARLREDIPGELFLGIAGVTSIALGALLLAAPKPGAFLLVVVLGSYALVFGFSMIMLALGLRRNERHLHNQTHAGAW